MISTIRLLIWPVMVAAVLAALPAHAQKEQKAAINAAEQKAAANAAPTAVSPQCSAPKELARLDRPLAHTSRLLAAGLPIRIVALGSSSTAGAGATTPDASYPSRLAADLRERFPDHDITVINRGVNGEEASDMLARLDKTVIAEEPDLVIWQLGTNSVLRDKPSEASAALIDQGVARIKATGADVILVDPQFAPKVISKHRLSRMLDLLALKSKQLNVNLFQRFAMMRDWREHQKIPFKTFVSPDELHMNDWSYACLARVLSAAIAEAATRPMASAAAAPRVRP
jgi:lysophospholipase L1-like esterase